MFEAKCLVDLMLWPLCRCIEIEIGMFVCEACEGLRLFRMHLSCEAGNEIVGNC